MEDKSNWTQAMDAVPGDGAEDVEILSTHTTGELHRAPATTPGAVHHTRSTPLPMRCRAGLIAEEHLTLEGVEIPWSQIQLLAVGQIHHSLGDMDGPKTMMRQMFGKVLGKDAKDDKKAGPRYQEFVFLDVIAQGYDSPFRLEAANINYRQFLDGEVAFISWHNFYKLVVRIARLARAARVTESAQAFLNRRREQMKKFGAVYDFETDTQHALARLDTMPAVGEADLSRENWAADWDEMEE